MTRGKGLKPLDPALGALIPRVSERAEAFPQMPLGFADFILLKCIIMARREFAVEFGGSWVQGRVC